jgi:hypothetical protein
VLRGAGRSAEQRADVERAQDTVDALQQRLAALEQEFAAETAALEAGLDPGTEVLEPIVIRPRKSDVEVRVLALAFAPHWRDANGQLEAAWT